ncbi:MAG: DNA topoisomerase I [Candidatus Aenigmatarchaeota archaeon]
MSFTLIISEKPDAATRISQALADGNVKKVGSGGAYWLEFERNGKKYVCVPAVGHLFVLNSPKNNSWNYPDFSAEWVPTYTNKGSEFTKKYFTNIQKLAKEASDFIVATDFDTEGEVIGYNILRFICKRQDAKRMKFSTLTKADLEEAFRNMMPHIDFGQAKAGLTRHYLDFYWGVNITRALTLAMRGNSNNFILVSSGRVQSPTLYILTQREREIKKFVPKPYWEIELHILLDGEKLVAVYEKGKIWEKSEAQKIFESCKGKDAIVKDIERSKHKQPPPLPLDTTTLQTIAYTHFKFSPMQTMSIAESLYNQGLISYPRTSSQKLPAKIGYQQILQKLSKISTYQEGCKKLLSKKVLKPIEGKKEDPAHPSIYPTGEFSGNLNEHQKKLYDLIVRRFLAVFGEDAIRETMKARLDVNGHNFLLMGKRTVEPGWIELYGKYAKFDEQILPQLSVGQRINVKDILLLDKETQPPSRYNQGSIIKEMEKRGLGTKATRANIIQTLYDRGYIKEKIIKVTEFGEKVSEVLEQSCPKIISEELTRKFEEEMEEVRLGKKRMEDVIGEAEDVLREILKEFKEKQKDIGEKLAKSYASFKKGEKDMGICPKCGGTLKIIQSKKSGKRFIGCKNYPKCECSYPLPQFGTIKLLDKKCPECHLPMIMVKVGKRKPYNMCINNKCKTKENWVGNGKKG